MKRIITFLALVTLTVVTANAQSVLERVVDALVNDGKKEDPTHKTIDAGGQVGLSVPKHIFDRYEVTSYLWSSSDHSKASVISSTKTSATVDTYRSTPGTVITYKYYYKTWKDGKEVTESATIPFTITINRVAPTAIKVNQETSVGWGVESYLKYELYPRCSEAAMQFDSDNPNAVTINSQGKAYGVALGDAIITIRTDNGLEASTHMECVIPAVSKLYINGYDKEEKLYVGDEIDLSYTFAPVHAQPTVRWYSSDKEIATVDENGHVKIVGKGTVHIYCASTTNNVKTDIKLKPKKAK